MNGVVAKWNLTTLRAMCRGQLSTVDCGLAAATGGVYNTSIYASCFRYPDAGSSPCTIASRIYQSSASGLRSAEMDVSLSSTC